MRMVAFSCSFIVVLTFSTSAHTQENPSGSSTANAESESGPNFLAIRTEVERYVAAYNAGNAIDVAKLFTENAELIDTAGTAYRGRGVIQAEYQAFFKTHPEASLIMVVDSITFVAPTVAIEEGQTESRLAPDQPPSFSKYVSVYAKQGDQWRLASVKDQEIDEEAGAKLEDLDWLIGQWIDETSESLMKIDCYWHESGSYLIRDFEITVEGLLASRGTERIGWDPLQQKARSWLFDSEGGFLEGTWVKQGDHWTIATHGYRPDGVPTHATYSVTPLRDDAYHMGATNRTAGRKELEDFEMTIVRRPPTPGDVPAVKTATENKSDSENTEE